MLLFLQNTSVTSSSVRRINMKKNLNLEFEGELIELFKRICQVKGLTMTDVLAGYMNSYCNENVALKEAALENMEIKK